MGANSTRHVVLYTSGSVLVAVVTLAVLVPADGLPTGAIVFAALLAAVMAPSTLRRTLDSARRATGHLASGAPDTDEGDQDERVERRVAARAAQLERRLMVAYEQRRGAAHARLTEGLVRELRTPIGVVHSSAEMARRMLPTRTGGEAPTLAKCLDLCESASERAMGLLRSLEALSQLETGDGSACDPRSVIGRAVECLAPRLGEAGTSIELDLAPVPSLVMPAPLFQRLVTHLLVNAVEAMPDGGRIDVALSGTLEGGVELAVQDTGAGIPSELRHRIFEPFFSTRESAEAAGLGLSVSRAVAEEHGGRIDLDGSYRGGARFVVTFARQVVGTTS